MRHLLLIFALLLTGCSQHPASAQVDIHDSGGPLLPEQAAYDVTYYDLSVQVFPDEQRISGELTVEADVVHPLEQLVLNLDTTMQVESIDVRDAASDEVTFERQGGLLWIHLPRTHQPGERIAATITYAGLPRVAPNPPWDGGFTWETSPDGHPWIATSNQGEGADLWWPVKDHVSDEPDSMRIHVRVPQELKVASNGRLKETVEHGDGTHTAHWFVSTPINVYNVALNIAPYVLIEDTYESVDGTRFPLQFWVLPEYEEEGRDFFPEIAEQLRFFEELLGPYPFRADKYGVAHTPHLGMEHQTIIAYGANFDNTAMTGRDWGFDALHQHELAHEWWGNLVTNPDWRDMWIHEGFGTYMQPLYAEELHGEATYLEYMQSVRGYIQNAEPVAPRAHRTTGEIYFDSGSDIYYKGAWVLHTLRYLIGDDDFFQALRTMAYPTEELRSTITGEQCRFASTRDFERIVEQITGYELDWFFEAYLRSAELPELHIEREGETVTLEWRTPKDIPFSLPVEVNREGELERIHLEDGRATLSVDPDVDIVADPNGWILRAE